MITPLEQRLQHARDRFIAEVVHAVEDVIIETIQRGFALALAQRSRAMVPPTANAPMTTHVPTAPMPAETERARTTQACVLACIRDAPGSHVGELSSSLGVPASTVRRHLRKLATAEAIRIETKPDPGSGEQELQQQA
jgi:DNA-binding transcriptional ArsR family regulator